MLQFSRRFAFINFLFFKPDTENNANFDTVWSKCDVDTVESLLLS